MAVSNTQKKIFSTFIFPVIPYESDEKWERNEFLNFGFVMEFNFSGEIRQAEIGFRFSRTNKSYISAQSKKKNANNSRSI